MKSIRVIMVVLSVLFLLSLHTAAQKSTNNKTAFSVLNGDYFGQKPPESIPELFAPDIFNGTHGYHTPIVFSPNLTEAIWSPMEMKANLMYSKMTNGVWSTPVELNFGFERGTGDGVFSPDGNELYFVSFQPPYTGAPEKERIWFAKRNNDNWSAPRLIDDVIVAHPTHWTFSFAKNKNLYFTTEIDGVRGEQDIYVARFDGVKYLPPEDLGEAINSDGKDLAPYIAPDESYLIFTRIGKNTKKTDSYISFKMNDGKWSDAIDMGTPINSDYHDLAPVVTPDGKYLFFLSQREGDNRIYWVDTKIIEELRLKAKNK